MYTSTEEEGIAYTFLDTYTPERNEDSYARGK